MIAEVKTLQADFLISFARAMSHCLDLVHVYWVGKVLVRSICSRQSKQQCSNTSKILPKASGLENLATHPDATGAKSRLQSDSANEATVASISPIGEQKIRLRPAAGRVRQVWWGYFLQRPACRPTVRQLLPDSYFQPLH